MLRKTLGFPGVAAALLAVRGYTTPESVMEFMLPESDPISPFDFLDMDIARGRILQALEENEKVCIFGDYDADGITATYVLSDYLENVLCMDVITRIPSRTQGYGLSCEAVDEIAAAGATLIITVDNGISAVEEVEHARSLGIDVIVTDHHRPGPVIPNAVAVVDAYRADCTSSYKHLSGAGIAFMLVRALEGDDLEPMDLYASIVALGTIADVVPLVGENRRIVRTGLHQLACTENMGVGALLSVCLPLENEPTAEQVAFTLTPRINAAGRMGDPNLALNLLRSIDPDDALELAQTIHAMNAARQKKEQEILEDIDEMLARDPSLLRHRALVLAKEGWYQGVLGIVAARMMERYDRPCLLITVEDGMAHGSARSFGDFSLFTLLSDCSEVLTRFGGHTNAAGFALEEARLPEFVALFHQKCRERYFDMPSDTLLIDLPIVASQLTLDTAEGVSGLEPYGAGNEKPLFLLRDAILEEVESVGNDRHSRLRLLVEGKRFMAMLFGTPANAVGHRRGDHLDMVVQLSVNKYNDRKSLTIMVKQMRPANFAQEEALRTRNHFRNFMREEPIAPADAAQILPTRQMIVQAYKAIRANKNGLNAYGICAEAACSYGTALAIMQILQELDLVHGPQSGRETAFLYAVENPAKTDLENSETLRKLRAASAQ